MDQIGAKIKDVTKYDKNTVKKRQSKIKRYPRKTHASFPISTVRIEMQKKCPI